MENNKQNEIQRVVSSTSAGVDIGTELGADGKTHSLSSIMQNIIPHTGSSSTTNLASAATFTGTSLDNLGVNAVQINFKADQNCTIQLQQSPDNSNWDYVVSYTVPANTADWRTFNAAGSYCRVLVTNNGGSTTTFLRLQTVIVPSMDVLPNSLTQSGNLKVETPPKQTYKASTIIPLVTAVTANVPFFNIIGSATKTITVKRISINGHTLTAVAYTTINVEKLSTASTGGTSTTLVATPLDNTNNAATAVVKAYTAIPTKGTLVGTVSSQRFLSQATTAAAAGIPTAFEFVFGVMENTHGIVLRGVAQELCLTYPVALATAGTCAIDVEWVEE